MRSRTGYELRAPSSDPKVERMVKRLRELASHYLRSYRTDLLYDYDQLRDPDSRKFIWIVRDSGTNLLSLWSAHKYADEDQSGKLFLVNTTQEKIRYQRASLAQFTKPGICDTKSFHDLYGIDIDAERLWRITQEEATSMLEQHFAAVCEELGGLNMWTLNEEVLREELELTSPKLSPRQIKNRVAKRRQEELQIRESPDVTEVVITIQWKKSPTWGLCPRASMTVHFCDAPEVHYQGAFYASGCGYCTESAVIARALNKALSKRLRQKGTCAGAPYGIRRGGDTCPPRFSEGTGVPSLRDCVVFLGGVFEHTSSGDDFDCYKVTFENPEK